MMIVAIVLLGLTGAALAALTQQFGTDLKRLQQQTDAAQGRQILIAGTRLLLRNPDKAVELPPVLLESGSILKIAPLSRGPDRAVFRLDAISGRFRASEMLTLSRGAGGWSIADAQLQ